MKYKIIAAILVIIVSAFSFSYGEAQVADHSVGHAVTAQNTLVTNLQTTTVGSTAWVQELTVPPGTATAWLLSYKNEGAVLVPKVVLHAAMPQNHTILPGSVTWFDPNFPAGYTLTDTGLFNEGVDIGGVAPGGNGFVRFRTIVARETSCGISSSASAYFEFGAMTNKHAAKVSTPACIPATVSTPAAVAPVSLTAQPVNTATESHTTHSSVTVTAMPAQLTTTQQPTTAQPGTQAVQSTSHDTTRHAETGQPTAAPVAATPAPAPTSAQVQTAASTSHTAHSVAGSTTPAVTPASSAPASSPSHSTHTIPETGGSPFWVMLGTLAAGYLAALLRNVKKLSYEAR